MYTYAHEKRTWRKSLLLTTLRSLMRPCPYWERITADTRLRFAPLKFGRAELRMSANRYVQFYFFLLQKVYINIAYFIYYEKIRLNNHTKESYAWNCSCNSNNCNINFKTATRPSTFILSWY